MEPNLVMCIDIFLIKVNANIQEANATLSTEGQEKAQAQVSIKLCQSLSMAVVRDVRKWAFSLRMADLLVVLKLSADVTKYILLYQQHPTGPMLFSSLMEIA